MQSTDERHSAAHAIAVLGGVQHSAAIGRPPCDYAASPCHAGRSSASLYQVVRRTALHRFAVTCDGQRRGAARFTAALPTALRCDACASCAAQDDAVTCAAEGRTAGRRGVDKYYALKRAVLFRMPARGITMQCNAVHVLQCIACIAVLGGRYVGYMYDTDSAASSAWRAIGAIAGSGHSETNIGYRKGSAEI